MTADDPQLLQRLRQRDPDAFAELFDLYSDRLYRLALGLLNNEDEAEGVVQDTFMRLIESLDRFEGRSGLGTWLYRVAHNAAIDRLRARRLLSPLPVDTVDGGPDDDLSVPVLLVDWTAIPEDVLSSAEARAQIEASIAGLSAGLRAVFILREIEGLSTLETAEALGIGESAVKVRLHRARLLLRESLSGYFGDLIATEERLT